MERQKESDAIQKLLAAGKLLEDGGANGPQIANHFIEQNIEMESVVSVMRSLGYLTAASKEKDSLSVSEKHFEGEVHPKTAIISLRS